MTDSRDDHEPIFVRSRWGTSRYVYNPHNTIGRALIVGSLVSALGGMYLLTDPPAFLGGAKAWSADGLRTALTDASAEMADEARFGPGEATYEMLLRDRVAGHGPGAEEALTIDLASERPLSAAYRGGVEEARYTVTADGTDAAFCLHVHAVRVERALGYASVSADVDDGACAEA